jgi:hypothetical protein
MISFSLYIDTLIWAYLDSQIAQFGYLGGMGYRMGAKGDTRYSGLALRTPLYTAIITQTNIKHFYLSQIINQTVRCMWTICAYPCA